MRNRGARIICAVALATAAGFMIAPAKAQFFPFDDRFFGPPRYYQPQRPRVEEDQTRAPAAKHAEVPPSIKILVIGDSMAGWLAYGLEEQLAETPEIGIVRKHRAYSGLIRYEQRSDTEWSKVARDLIAAEKPQAIVVLLGLHDRQAMRERTQAAPAKPAPAKSTAAKSAPQKAGAAQPKPDAPAASATTPPATPDANANDDESPVIAAPEPQRARPTGPLEFRSERWEELYGARVDETIAALKSANVPVLWVGVPAIRGLKQTADLQYLNEIFRARAEKAGFIYVNVWEGFVDERNNFMQRGPDETGQIRQLRTYDGIHFTKFGARKLAHYVERDLRRVLREPIPAALSASADPALAMSAPQAKPATPASTVRPLAGPVIPLGTPLQEPDDLLGGGPAKNAALDPLANKMLVKGEPMRSEAGRADDFSWPPRMPNLKATEPLPPTGAPLAVVRAPAPASPTHAAAKPGAPAAPGARVAGAQRPQQAPTFWRRQVPDYSGPRFFFGLFGGR
jgi:hypothetical protein